MFIKQSVKVQHNKMQLQNKITSKKTEVMAFFEALSTTFLILIKETIRVSQTNIRIAHSSYNRTIYLYNHSSPLNFILITYIFSFMFIYYQCTEKNQSLHVSLSIPCSIHLKKNTKISSYHFSCSFTSDSLQPHGLQHVRLPCPSPTPRAYSNSCPSSQ